MANEVGFIDVEGCLWDESKDDEMDPIHVGQPPGSASKKYQYASTGTEGKKSGSSGELFQVTREPSFDSASQKLQAVPEDKSQVPPTIRTDIPAGEKLFQFFKLVRVGTGVSNASTEIISNTSPSHDREEKLDKLSEASHESPASSPRTEGHIAEETTVPKTPESCMRFARGMT